VILWNLILRPNNGVQKRTTEENKRQAMTGGISKEKIRSKEVAKAMTGGKRRW